jgi:hypothetical protein
MASVLVTWTAPAAQFPEGTVEEHHYRVRLGDLEDHTEPLDIHESLFVDVAPGDYIPHVVLCDIDGNLIGEEAVGASITVPEPPAPTVTRHPPVGVAASLVP